MDSTAAMPAMSAWRRLRRAGWAFWLALCVMLASAAAPAARAQDEPGTAAADANELDDEPAIAARELAPDEEAAVRRELAEPVPDGLRGAQLEAFFAQRHQRAAMLGGRAAYQVSVQWHARAPQSFRATWALARAQFHFGRAAAFEQFTQQAFDLAPGMLHKARIAAEAALALADAVADLDGAGRWIERGEAALSAARNGAERQAGGGRRAERGSNRDSGANAGGHGTMARAFAAAALLGAKSRVQTLHGHFADAITDAHESIAAAQALQQQALASGRPRSINSARAALARAWLGLAQAQLRGGFTFDAEQSWRSADAVIAGGATGHGVRIEALELGSVLRLMQGRIKESEQLARQLVDLTGGRRGGPPSASHIRARLRLQDALAGQQRWADAWAQMQATDARLALAPELAALGTNPQVRGWVLLSLGQPAQARAVLEAGYRRALELLGSAHVDTAMTGGLYAWALWASGARDEARQVFDAVMPELVAPRGAASSYFEQGLQRPLRKAIGEAYLRAVATDPLRAATALPVADWLIGVAVQQAMAEATVRATVPPDVAPLVRNEQDLRHHLDALRAAQERAASDGDVELEPEARAGLARRIRETAASHEQARLALARAWPLEQRADALPKVDVPSIAARLGPDEVFALLLPTAAATYLWTVDAGAHARFAVAAADEQRIASLVDRVRATIEFGATGKPPPFDADAASQLHAALVEPLAESLRGRRHLIVAAGGALGRLPLALLAPSAAPRWLISQVAVTQVPNAGAWLALGRLPRMVAAREPLIGWGDPLFDPAKSSRESAEIRHLVVRSVGDAVDYARIPALPETRDELRAIAAVLRAAPDRDLYLGERATRESVLQSSRAGDLARRRVVVFATHGLMAGDLPGLNQPALALASTARAERDPLSPLLTLDDVLGLKMNADWVVLSACNTAAADGKAEEALSGLARGFFYAGARSLLVTHWAVETESAKRLTTGTFEYYAAHPEAGKAESLRQAMLALIADPKYSHPAYWAPYALVGDGAR